VLVEFENASSKEGKKGGGAPPRFLSRGEKNAKMAQSIERDETIER